MTTTNLNHSSVSLEQFAERAITDGAAVIELSQELLADIDLVRRRVSSQETNYQLDSLGLAVPALSALGSILAGRAGIKAHRVGLANLALLADTGVALLNKQMHVDSNAPSGLSLLVPLAGPEAKFFHAEEALTYPFAGADCLVYGVGRAVLLRQQLSRMVDGMTTVLPQRFHVGVSQQAARTLLTIDLSPIDQMDCNLTAQRTF